MKAYVFPGQGAQFPGMGKDLYDHSDALKARFELANEILGFDIADTMFNGSPEDLKQTSVTQPAIFIHSVVLAEALGDAFQPDVAAGRSLVNSQPWSLPAPSPLKTASSWFRASSHAGGVR